MKAVNQSIGKQNVIFFVCDWRRGIRFAIHPYVTLLLSLIWHNGSVLSSIGFLFCCAGRAIRHSRDYSSILLLDQRYLRSSITSKLPSWISRSLQSCDNFGPAFSAMRKVSCLTEKCYFTIFLCSSSYQREIQFNSIT